MMDGDGSCGRYWVALGDYFGRVSFFGRRSPQMGNADRAQIFFIVGVAFFDADRDLGLLRGGRISAD